MAVGLGVLILILTESSPGMVGVDRMVKKKTAKKIPPTGSWRRDKAVNDIANRIWRFPTPVSSSEKLVHIIDFYNKFLIIRLLS